MSHNHNNNHPTAERDASRLQNRQHPPALAGGSASQAPNTSNSRLGTQKNAPIKNESELECYLCGEKGHILSDPICKNFHKRGNHP